MIQGMLDALVVLLAASVAAVVLLRALGLPSAVAYLMVGLMVGPHGFDWIAHTDGVHRLGEFGIVFLLFTLGLEFTLGEMRKAGAVVLSLGLA
jgi:CPA2 family monovalent cation:H+ antiporter-2